MASAAYDERRLLTSGSGDDQGKIASLENELIDSGWVRLTGASVGQAGSEIDEALADDASISDPASGMQADVWSRGNEIVISFRGTEISRSDPSSISVFLSSLPVGANNDERKDDADLDVETLAAWSGSLLAHQVFDQARAALSAIQDVIALKPTAEITLTGHSLGGALASLAGISLEIDAVAIDPAPIGSSVMLASAVAQFDESETGGILASYVLGGEEALSDEVDTAMERVGAHVSVFRIDDTITDANFDVDILGAGAENPVFLPAIGMNIGEKALFLHSASLHALITATDGVDRNMQGDFADLTDAIPSLLLNMSKKDVFGLLGSVDAGEINQSSLADDYSSDITINYLVADPALYEIFDRDFHKLTLGGAAGHEDTPYTETYNLSDPSDPLEPEAISFNDYFVRIGLQEVRELARTLGFNAKKTDPDKHNLFGTLDGVVGTYFPKVVPPELTDIEDREVYGDLQAIEIASEILRNDPVQIEMAGATQSEVDLAIENLFPDKNDIHGVLAQAKGTSDTTIDIHAYLQDVPEQLRSNDPRKNGAEITEHNFIVFGGLGKDTILPGRDGLAGRTWVFGDKDDDTIKGGDGDDVLFGGADHDDLFGTLSSLSITESSLELTLSGISEDKLFGGDGADRVVGSAGNDSLSGGDGSDFLVVTGAGDQVRGGVGNDSYFILPVSYTGIPDPQTRNEIYLEEGFGRDSVFLASQNFFLNRSTVVFEGVHSSNVKVSFDYEKTTVSGTISGTSGLTNNTPANFTFLTGGLEIAVEGTADSLYIDNYSMAYGRTQVEYGGIFSNLLFSAFGVGISATQEILGQDFGSPFAVQFDDKIVTDWREFFGVDVWDIQRKAITPGAASALPNHLEERQQGEILVSSAGDDTATGGGGDDYVYSSAGNDSYDGLGGSDTLDYGLATAPIIVSPVPFPVPISEHTISSSEFGNDTFDNFETIIAGSGDDNIRARGSLRNVTGGDGDDFILLESTTGQGNEILAYGGSGNDIISSLTFGHSLFGGADDDHLLDLGDGFLFGGTGNDIYEIRLDHQILQGGESYRR